MTEKINWLHITDLHFGLDDKGWLWPRVKNDFLNDASKLAELIGGLDLVFFTGDLTQTGQVEEFTSLNKELEMMWATFSKHGLAPSLCVVPGNHDLLRPKPDSLVAKSLKSLWGNDPDLRRTFWREEKCELREGIDEVFKNYNAWLNNLPVPSLPTQKGIIPGDFSASFKKGKIELGIVGLNSTFLQVCAGDFKQKLELHVSQLNAVCGGDPKNWLNKYTASVLLTHQPPSWLSVEAHQHFRQEIYVPEYFVAQFCGHQHEPESFELSEAGAAPRRLRQGPSLFGLEHWDGPNPIKRIHGYTMGQYIFESSSGIEKFWPRIAVLGRHGGLNLAPDHSYKLREEECVVLDFDLTNTGEAAVSAEPSKIDSVPGGGPELLSTPPAELEAHKRLSASPRLNLGAGPQHRQIRLEEQSQFELYLRKERFVWILADWGAGREGFLASAIERFRENEVLPECFHIRCDDAESIDTFEALFSQQCGMSLQAFCGYTASLRGPFLVLDGLHPSICRGEPLTRLRGIISAILDYCPSLRLVLVSRLRPENDDFPKIELRPLDLPDVLTYVSHHPDGTPDLREADVIEMLHEQSDGLPRHLDKMLKELKVSSLPSVIIAHREGAGSSGDQDETTPKALIHAISSLLKSQERRSIRSLRLLKVLSVLPYGDTLETLRHFLPTEPFHPENALQLNELALLDVISLQSTKPGVGLSGRTTLDQTVPKVLKVPRQVRDYLQHILSEQEREEIVLAGIDRFFGRSWRQGKIKLRILPIEYREWLNSGPGNEFALIHHLISQGRTQNDEAAVRRGAKLGVQYAYHLENSDRFRDLSTVAGGLAQLLDQQRHQHEWSQLNALHGTGLRMIGKPDEALKYLRAAIETGESYLSNTAKSSAWLDIALAEQRLKHNEMAIGAAKKVQEYEDKTSAKYLHAEYIIANLTLTNEEERKLRISDIEKRARAWGHDLADTILLDLAHDADNALEKVRHLDKVLASGERGYNQVRAVVAKAESLQQLANSTELKPQEFARLVSGYSYLHAQRFGNLFDRCHKALWSIFEARDDESQLLRMFRHSSFMWRLRGEEQKESEYLAKLKNKSIHESDPSRTKALLIEFKYFMGRLKVVILG